MSIKFYKFESTGNDFIIIDNRVKSVILSNQQIKKICDRRFGVGANGLIFYNQSNNYDFEMKYFNANGYEGSMCGNGGRSLIAFSHFIGDAINDVTFNAVDGMHKGSIISKSSDKQWLIKLQMIEVEKYKMVDKAYDIDTGSPHYVEFLEELKDINVYEKGRSIRYNDVYVKNGTNVNFVEVIDENKLFVRTYERGVEDETYSCGTGVTASALAYAIKNNLQQASINIKVFGGNLKVSFEREGNKFYNIWLEGSSNFIFKGEMDIL
jgi:diaminopimelate epimerase